MLWWISGGEVVGPAAGEKPANFTEVEGVEAADREAVFFDGQTVQLRGDRPSEGAVWDGEQWVDAEPVELPALKNWQGLEDGLRGTPLWEKAYGAGERTLKANIAFTLLYGTVTNTHNENDLRMAIYKLREAMAAVSGVGDFTEDELEAIGRLLEENGFDSEEFPLGEA